MTRELTPPSDGRQAAAASGRQRPARTALDRGFCFLALALCLLLPLGSGCRRKASAPPAAPVPAAAPPAGESFPQAVTPVLPPKPEPPSVQPLPVPKVVDPPGSFRLGEESFRAGRFSDAIREFQEYLETNPDAAESDVALFHVGLSYALADNSGKGARRAEDALKRLLQNFPESPYASPARLILSLQEQVESMKSDLREKEARIRQLSEELQKIKEIDLQRRPPRPSF